jgi:hypothetical protein
MEGSRTWLIFIFDGDKEQEDTLGRRCKKENVRL